MNQGINGYFKGNMVTWDVTHYLSCEITNANIKDTMLKWKTLLWWWFAIQKTALPPQYLLLFWLSLTNTEFATSERGISSQHDVLIFFINWHFKCNARKYNLTVPLITKSGFGTYTCVSLRGEDWHRCICEGEDDNHDKEEDKRDEDDNSKGLPWKGVKFDKTSIHGRKENWNF